MATAAVVVVDAACHATFRGALVAGSNRSLCASQTMLGRQVIMRISRSYAIALLLSRLRPIRYDRELYAERAQDGVEGLISGMRACAMRFVPALATRHDSVAI